MESPGKTPFETPFETACKSPCKSPGNDQQPTAFEPTVPIEPRRARERFSKSMRMRSQLDFDDLFKNGRVVADKVLVVHARAAKSHGKIGISISKRVGHAPLRNLWKRLIREAYRRLAARKPEVRQIDLVVRPRRGATASFQAIQRSLASASSRLIDQVGRRTNEPGTTQEPP